MGLGGDSHKQVNKQNSPGGWGGQVRGGRRSLCNVEIRDCMDIGQDQGEGHEGTRGQEKASDETRWKIKHGREKGARKERVRNKVKERVARGQGARGAGIGGHIVPDETQEQSLETLMEKHNWF